MNASIHNLDGNFTVEVVRYSKENGTIQQDHQVDDFVIVRIKSEGNSMELFTKEEHLNKFKAIKE